MTVTMFLNNYINLEMHFIDIDLAMVGTRIPQTLVSMSGRNSSSTRQLHWTVLTPVKEVR